MARMLIWTVALLSIDLLSGLLTAPLSACNLPQGLVVDTYNEIDGLPSSAIHDIHGAPSGLLWFATRAGIVAYDGDSWQPVFPDLNQTGRDTLFLRFDRAGGCWIVLSDGLVVRTEPGAFKDVASQTVIRQARGLMATGSILDFELLETGSEPIAALLESRQGLLLWREGHWEEQGTATLQGPVLAIESFGGRLFVGSEGGLSTIDAGGQSAAWKGAGELLPGPIQGLGRGRGAEDELLWIYGEDWLGRLNARFEFELFARDVPNLGLTGGAQSVHLAQGKSAVVIGNATALFVVDSRTRRASEVLDELGNPINGVNALYTKGEGLIWGATGTGAFKLLDIGLSFLGKANGLMADEVTAITERAPGSIVLGHYGGLTLFSGLKTTRLPFEGYDPAQPAFTRVMDLTTDRLGNVWIAGAGFGAGRLSPNDQVEWWRGPATTELWINAVHETKKGQVLVGTSRGLYCVSGQELGRFGGVELEKVFVRRIEVGRDGTIYLATPQSLWVGKQGEWTQVRPNITGFKQFYTVFEDHMGRVWCGSRQGIWILRQGKLRRAGPAYDVGRPVFSVCEAQFGELWIGTDHGFLRSNGRELERFGWFAGRTGYECNRAAALCASDGRIWLGTTKGVSVIEPAFGVEQEPIRIDPLEVRVGSDVYPLDGPDNALSVHIPFGQNNVSLRLRALSFLNEHEMEFRSRMVGLTEWKLSRGTTVLNEHFSGLPPGRFTFEAQARPPGGKFGEVWESPQMTVAEPVWKREWFLFLLTASGAILLASSYSYVSQHRQARRLGEEVEERTRDLESSLAELAKTDRLRSLGFLAGGIAHDLRNVLTVLTGNLSLLREHSKTREDLGAYLDPIDGALDRATQLASQLQTFSTGGAPIKSAISLSDVLHECADLLLSGSRVTVDFDIEEDLWPADADQAQVRQVIENLLMNARQCQPQGGWVRVVGRNVEKGSDPEQFVEILVADGGPGISSEELRHIFDPFFSTKPGGSGLGLTTAFSIVQRHDGVLDVSSTGASGTVFRLLLPAASEDLKQVTLQPRQRLPEGLGRILVVDDDSNIRVLLVSMLKRLGYKAVAAGSSQEALEVLRKGQQSREPVRFAIVDHTLPGDLSGPEILVLLREIEPDLRAIASSGYSAEAALSLHEANGFQGVLPKPYRMADLARAMVSLACTLSNEPAP